MRRLGWIIATTVTLLSLWATASGALEDTSWALFESDKDRKVEVRVNGGRVFVRGADTDTVSVRAKLDTEDDVAMPEDADDPRAAGLRRVTGGPAGLEIWSEDNLIEISTSPFAGSADLYIRVPKDIDLEVKAQFADSVVVRGILRNVSVDASGSARLEQIGGDVEVRTQSGWIFLDQISGGIVANSQFGGIEGKLTALDVEEPISLSASGHIDVSLPSSARATLNVKTSFGEVLTDLDVAFQHSKDAKAPRILSVTDGEARRAYSYYVYSQSEAPEVIIEHEMDKAKEDLKQADEELKKTKEKAREEAEEATEVEERAKATAERDAKRLVGRSRIRARVAPDGKSFYVAPPDVPIVVIPEMPAVPYGASLVGELNGGGTEVRLTSMSGNIYIRKIKSGKK